MRDRRALWLAPVAALQSTLVMVLAFGAFAGSALAAPEPQAPDRALRVLNYNIHHGAGNDACTAPPKTVPPRPECSLNLARIADVIRAQQPDVVTLQEVDRFWARSAYVDQPAALGGLLGMEHACYGANLVHEADTHADRPHEYGTLILSRFPILECRNTYLPKIVQTNEQRGLLEALIAVRGVPVRVYNTHLQHNHAEERALQVRTILDLIGAAGEPTVLAGDLNARPAAAELQPLYASEFVDAWLAGGNGGPGYTYPADTDREPDRRIDYLFVSPDIAVHQTVVALDDATRLAADHLPVVAGLTVPGAGVGIGRE